MQALIMPCHLCFVYGILAVFGGLYYLTRRAEQPGQSTRIACWNVHSVGRVAICRYTATDVSPSQQQHHLLVDPELNMSPSLSLLLSTCLSLDDTTDWARRAYENLSLRLDRNNST